MTDAAFTGLYAGLAVAMGLTAFVCLLAAVSHVPGPYGRGRPSLAVWFFLMALTAIALCGMFGGMAGMTAS